MIPPGSIEVNDVNAIFRAWMAAATGTFAGSFSATNINAISTINIKDGAVSAYYAFSVAGGTDTTFTIPAQNENYRLTLRVPLAIHALNPMTARARIYRNGVKIEDYTIDGSTDPYGFYPNVFPAAGEEIPDVRVMDYVDWGANTLVSNTYRILLTISTSGSLTSVFYFLSKALAEIRKR